MQAFLSEKPQMTRRILSKCGGVQNLLQQGHIQAASHHTKTTERIDSFFANEQEFT